MATRAENLRRQKKHKIVKDILRYIRRVYCRNEPKVYTSLEVFSEDLIRVLHYWGIKYTSSIESRETADGEEYVVKLTLLP